MLFVEVVSIHLNGITLLQPKQLCPGEGGVTSWKGSRGGEINDDIGLIQSAMELRSEIN